MNSYFEQSGFYGSHGQTGAEQAYRFPLGLGVNPYGPPSNGGRPGVQESPYDAAAAAAAASCKLYEQQYKIDCGTKDQNGYSTSVKDQNSISSWAAAAAAAAAAAGAAQGMRSDGGHARYGSGVPVGVTPNGDGAVSAITPRSLSGSGGTGNPWSPCSLNQSVPGTGIPGSQHGVVHSQHPQIGQQQSPQSQSSAHTFYPWMAIAGELHNHLFVRISFGYPPVFPALSWNRCRYRFSETDLQNIINSTPETRNKTHWLNGNLFEV